MVSILNINCALCLPRRSVANLSSEARSWLRVSRVFTVDDDVACVFRLKVLDAVRVWVFGAFKFTYVLHWVISINLPIHIPPEQISWPRPLLYPHWILFILRFLRFSKYHWFWHSTYRFVTIISYTAFAGAKLLGLLVLDLDQVGVGEGQGNVSALEGGGFWTGGGRFLGFLFRLLVVRYVIKIDTFRFFTVLLLLLFHTAHFI